MPASSTDLFATAATDHLGIFDDDGEPDAKKIAAILHYNRRDVSAAADLPISKVRLEPNRIPRELAQRITEWGIALNTVAEHFKDPKRTILWFGTPNPLLGNLAPRDMIRLGRSKKLFRFIQTSLSEHRP